MSQSIPPSDKTPKIEADQKSLSESFFAKQILSEGPRLKQSISRFSRFTWLPTQFSKSSFISTGKNDDSF